MNSNRPVSEPTEAYRGFYKVIAPLVMCSGVGDGQTTACVMAQAATIDALRKGKTLDEPTDEMECACPVLRRLAIRLNDCNWWASDAERTDVLRPLIPMLLDSRGSKAVTDRRVFFVADKAVRELTPMRLEWIAANTKSAIVKSDVQAGAKKLKALREIKDKTSALAARDECEKLQASATAYADASAAAYADAYTAAYAYADAYTAAVAYAYAYAAAYAYAYAAAYADADAYAAAYADADAYTAAYADAAAQKLKYRNSLLQLFKDCAAIVS